MVVDNGKKSSWLFFWTTDCAVSAVAAATRAGPASDFRTFASQT